MNIELVEGAHGRFAAYQNDLITDQIKQFGAHTRNEIAFLLSVVRGGDSVIDLGAHIGTFTVPLAKAVGRAGRVVAIEANPATFSLLQLNMHLNAVADRVTCLNVPVGAGDECGGAMTIPPGNSGAAFFGRGAGTPTWPLSRIMLATDMLQPAVVKIDIEGMEASVLGNSIQILRLLRPIIYLEISEPALVRNGSSSNAVEALLRNLDYALYRNAGHRNSTTDKFVSEEIVSFSSAPKFFDCLAIHKTMRERADWAAA